MGRGGEEPGGLRLQPQPLCSSLRGRRHHHVLRAAAAALAEGGGGAGAGLSAAGGAGGDRGRAPGAGLPEEVGAGPAPPPQRSSALPLLPRDRASSGDAGRSRSPPAPAVCVRGALSPAAGPCCGCAC